MIATIWALIVLFVLIGTWVSVIERAMMMNTPLVLRHEMEIRGTPERGLWIESQYETVLQSLTFVKTMFFAYIMLGFVLLFYTKPLTVVALFTGQTIGIVVFWFFASVVAGLAEIARRLTGANLKKGEGLNAVEEQLLRSIEHSQREGGIPAESAEMLENVVDLRDTDVGEIMTPRIDIEGVEMTNDISAIRKFVLESGRSRIPIFEENLDQIIGILYVKDLVGFLGAEATGFELKNILRKPIVVPDTKPVQELLADFQTSEVHMAVVIDEYGGTAGLVTIEDVLEEIVGEIRDEHDDAEADEPALKKVSDLLVEVDGRYNLDDLNDELGIALPEDEEYDTIAGFVLANLGHVPEVGEVMEIQNMVFTTLRATETQIERVSISFSETDD